VTYDFTLHLRIPDHPTWFWRCVGMAFGHFLLGSHDLMVMALGSCVKWPLLLHTARLLQLLNVEHQTGALIDQSMSPIGSQNYGSWTLCKVLAYPHPTAGEVYFRWVAGIRERPVGINHLSGKLDIFVYLYPSSLWVYSRCLLWNGDVS